MIDALDGHRFQFLNVLKRFTFVVCSHIAHHLSAKHVGQRCKFQVIDRHDNTIVRITAKTLDPMKKSTTAAGCTSIATAIPAVFMRNCKRNKCNE